MLNPQIAVTVVKTLSTMGVTSVLKEVLKNNMSEPESALQAFNFRVGKFVIGAMATAAAATFIDGQVEDGKKQLEEIQEKLAEQKEKPQEEETQ